MSPTVQELAIEMAAKKAECEAHQDRTDRIGDTLHDPETGLVVRMATVSERLNTLQTLSYAQLSLTIAVLLALVGYFYHENQQKIESKRTGETEIIPTAVAFLK